jgi:lipopolysaccharide export system permease protein
MIFQRALLREFSNSGLATFVVLLAITVTTQFIRFLGMAARGNISTEAVLTFLGFASLRYLPIIVSLTLFISILTVLTRSYRDSEMVVWFSSGQSLLAWVRPVLVYAAPLVIIVALLSLLLSPWAALKSDEYRRQLESRDDVAAVSPGVFKESTHSNRVFFVERLTGDLSTVANIFVHSEQDEQVGVMVAQRGYQETSPKGDRYLVLQDGRRYEGEPGLADYKVTRFDKYALRIEKHEAKDWFPSISGQPTADLLREPSYANNAELVWRFGLPVSALVLALLAVPMSFVNPRAGRSSNLVLAILLYMIYSNLLSMSQSWVSQQKISTLTGMLSVHLCMLAVVGLMFLRRLSVTSIWGRWRS